MNWQDRVTRLRANLLESTVTWDPWQTVQFLSVRRGTRLSPEVVAEMEEVLEFLRDGVARATGEHDLEAFRSGCAGEAARLEELAEQWRALGRRATEEGVLLLEEADRLKQQGRRKPLCPTLVLKPEEWPPLLLRLLEIEGDRDFPPASSEIVQTPQTALRSLRLLLDSLKASSVLAETESPEKESRGS